MVDKNRVGGDILKVAEKKGESLTFEEYKEHGKYNHRQIQSGFGTWNNAKEMLGLETNNRPWKRVSEKEILEDLARQALGIK